jgi:hypothetical protein
VSKRDNWLTAGLMMLGFLLVIGAGMNGLLWFEAPPLLRFPARLLLFGSGLWLVWRQVMRWSRAHVNTFVEGSQGQPNGPYRPRRRKEKSPDATIPRVRMREARELLERELNEFTPLSAEALASLALNLGAPQAGRRAIHERKTLSGGTMDHEVTVDLRPEATIDLGNGQRVVVLARPEWGTWYGRLTASADGDRLMVLSLTKCLALLYAACRWPIFEPLVGVDQEEKDDLLDQLADLIVSPVPSLRTRRALVARLAAAMELSDGQKYLLVSLIRLASLRRPIFAAVPGKDPLTSVTYSYTTSVAQYDHELPMGIDPWRRLKDRFRQRLGLPSKFVAFPMDRARAAEPYVLDVHIPPGLYVDEAYLLSRGQTLQPMDRRAVRPGFLSRTVLNGREDVRVVAWDLRKNKAARNPMVVVRMVETPPGSVFSAFLVAVAVLLSVWLTGVASGTLAERFAVHEFSPAAFGVVTLAITLPGLLSSWWGITFSRTTGSFRSLTGLISLTVSVGLSLITLVAYVARFAVGRRFPWDMYEGKTIYLIHDGYSFTLFVLALVNVCVVLSLFTARLWRFQSLKSGKRPVGAESATVEPSGRSSHADEHRIRQ